MNQDTTSQPEPNAPLMQIPGFHGYKEIQHRRESDRLLRQMLADLLESSQRKLEHHLAGQVDRGILSSLPAGERLISRIDQLRQSVNSKVDDCREFFDGNDCSVDQLNRLHGLESRLLATSVTIDEISASLAGDPRSSLDMIGKSLDEVMDCIAQRSELLETTSV